MPTEQKAKAYDEALEQAAKELNTCGSLDCDAARQIFRFFPQLAESEDEKTWTWLLDYAIEMIAGLESDISLSTYDGVKGHDPEAEAELAQWQKARAYLEKQKEQMPMPEDTVLFQKGVEEGRRLERDDLALTWEDMVLLRTLFDATDANQSMGALTVQPMTREYYEYLLREFNEQRKK